MADIPHGKDLTVHGPPADLESTLSSVASYAKAARGVSLEIW